MPTKKFLLVCEGPTDIEILSAIANKVSNNNGHLIELSPLSPQLDATSGQFPPHGWTAVKAWCKANRTKKPVDVIHLPQALQAVALRKDWRIIVAASDAEGLIIQIDTDIAEHISDLPKSFKNSGLDRKSYTRNAILHWLAEPAVAQPMFLVLSTYSTETWILACHDSADPIFADLPAGFNYESISDVEPRLIRKGLPSINKRGTRKLKKSPTRIYARHGAQVATALTSVRIRCQEVDAFCSFLESV